MELQERHIMMHQEYSEAVKFSHKWWETETLLLQCKTSIPALRRPGGGLVMAPAEKPLLLRSSLLD